MKKTKYKKVINLDKCNRKTLANKLELFYLYSTIFWISLQYIKPLSFCLFLADENRSTAWNSNVKITWNYYNIKDTASSVSQESCLVFDFMLLVNLSLDFMIFIIKTIFYTPMSFAPLNAFPSIGIISLSICYIFY